METSVISVLAARPSKDVIVAGQQASTHHWWREKRRNYEIFVSKLVWQEAGEGDTEAAERRLRYLRPFRWLQINSAVAALARSLVEERALPPNAGNDALHIALGAVYNMQFLLTWNFAHINNPATEEQIRSTCRRQDYHCPIICSPDQLLSI